MHNKVNKQITILKLIGQQLKTVNQMFWYSVCVLFYYTYCK